MEANTHMLLVACVYEIKVSDFVSVFRFLFSFFLYLSRVILKVSYAQPWIGRWGRYGVGGRKRFGELSVGYKAKLNEKSKLKCGNIDILQT